MAPGAIVSSLTYSEAALTTRPAASRNATTTLTKTASVVLSLRTVPARCRRPNESVDAAPSEVVKLWFGGAATSVAAAVTV